MMTFVVLILSICAISLITVLISSMRESYENTMVKPFTYYSLAQSSSTDLYLNQTVVNKLKSDKNIEKLISCDIEYTDITLAITSGGSLGFFANKSDIQYFLNKSEDKIKEGRLPNNKTNEIAVHWRIMANKDWKIGQVVGNDKDPKESLTGSYKIVGTLDGPNVEFIGTQTNRQRQYIANGLDTSKPVSYAIFPKTGKLDEVNSKLDKIDKNKAYVTNYNQMRDNQDEMFSSIDFIVTAIIVIVTIILSISISSLMYLTYIQRSDEFGILLAMGYRKSFVYKLILKELFILNVISWVVGIATACALVQTLNHFIYLPQGNSLNFFENNVFLNTIYIPIFAAIFSILPIILKMKKQDPITVIERRD